MAQRLPQNNKYIWGSQKISLTQRKKEKEKKTLPYLIYTQEIHFILFGSCPNVQWGTVFNNCFESWILYFLNGFEHFLSSVRSFFNSLIKQ